MDTAGPAAGALLAFLQFFGRAHDPALTGRGLFGVLDPADEFVAAQRRQALPKREDPGVGLQGGLKIGLSLVDGALRKFIH